MLNDAFVSLVRYEKIIDHSLKLMMILQQKAQHVHSTLTEEDCLNLDIVLLPIQW